MDRKYIIEHNMMEAHKQFMRLSEGYLATDLSEEGDDTNTNQGEDIPQMGNDMPQTVGNMPGGDENTGEELNPGQTDEMPGEDGAPGEDLPQMGGDLPPVDEPQLDDNVEDDVLDVEDLTQAQEKLNKKQNSLGHDLGEVDDRIVKLLTAVEKIQGAIEKNNNDITDLKSELEMRMPTKTEKLNMQSLKMYPFNVSPKDYWNDKEKDGVYQAEYDSQEPEVKKEYKITQDDVDNYTDREIEDSFDKNEKLRQTMKDIFKGF